MDTRRISRSTMLAMTAAIVALGSMASGGAAHLGDSGHIHVPGDTTTHTSSVWCVQFTRDPGAWRPEGVTAVDSSLLENVSVVFVDCAELLGDNYAIESFAGGQLSRTIVNESVIGQPAETSDDAAAGVTGEFITASAWARHQKQWLAKGDRLATRLAKVKTFPQAKKALGAMQHHLRDESQWLQKNKRRFEPDSCLGDDMALWKKHVARAQKSLNKAVTAMNRSNLAAMSTNSRQFGRSWTKLEQVYNAGVCDF